MAQLKWKQIFIQKMLEREAESSTRLNVLTSDQYRGLIDEVSPLNYFHTIEGYVIDVLD